MSKQDNFSRGFILGTILGGVVGGIVGTVIASKNKSQEDKNNSLTGSNNGFSWGDEKENIQEDLRMSLEDKINQLNEAIDEMKWNLVNDSKQKQEKEI